MKKHQIVYQTNLDYEETYENLCRWFPSVEVYKGNIVFSISEGVHVLISPQGKVQVAWSNKEEKKTGLKVLKEYGVPRNGEKEVKLKPLHQSITNIPYPEPEGLEIFWCEKGTYYFSFNCISQLKEDWQAILEDYCHTLDFDSAQRRAADLYHSNVLPESWKKQLEPLFKPNTLLWKLKPHWVREFLTEMRRLIWQNSR